jgi:hypothetical protein
MVVIRRELPSDSVTRVRREIDLPQWHIDEDSPFRVPFGRFILFNKTYLSGCYLLSAGRAYCSHPSRCGVTSYFQSWISSRR